MVIRSATKVTKEVLRNATNLKVVGRAGVGTDNIDIAECTKYGVMVMNTPGGNTLSTAQLAFTLLCSAARQISQADFSMKNGKWERKKFMGTELSGKTLAVVGCGRIGQQVAKWAQGFNMKIVGFDPALPKDVAEEMGIELMDLDDLWRMADFITLHTPLTPDTKNLIGKEAIDKMKKGVILINCARGGIINEEALLKGLESGKVGSAALDVYASEPPPESANPLLSHPNVVCTPHLGASTEEAQVNVARDIAVQMSDTLNGVDYVGVINVGYMAMANEPQLQPYLSLSEVIGKLHSQTTKKKVSKVQLKTYGSKVFSIETKSARNVILAQFLKGLLSYYPGVSALPNLISSPLIASEMGIKVEIDTKLHPNMVSSPYSNIITVDVEFEDKTKKTISGSVFGKQGKIVQIDNYQNFSAFKPENTLLSFRNEDRPGAVSGVLKILSESGMNVATMNVGRQEGELALCLMGLDDYPTKEVVEKLNQLGALKDVHVAQFN
eukprot:CAMPEP_0171458552 /NCGR_PEP_ID=MMETSP0945-20130129/4185_1 /TAXON_ID=109269 /ORGANISM="Vaucheria litorea, Strain CCMP2940" /LENGTH=496 /DNA_ID=CAMNT_0011984383 /DNA_START=253 /DNA_END=1743 /DNA_ORIENTATION=+